jgi:hypothetical protein
MATYWKLLYRKVLFLFIVCLPVSATAATPPAWINFQGRLLDNNGIPLTASNMTVTASLWSDSVSTLPADLKYQETHYPISVDDGVYSFPLGSGTPVSGTYGSSLYTTNNALWLEITVTPEGGSPETLTPRHRLLSAPYTNQSGNSENLGGQPITYFGTAAQVSSLQGQINNLSSQLGALQSVCEASGNIWDGSQCLKATRVVDYFGQLVPVEQDNVQLSLPNILRECLVKHYRPVEDLQGNPLEVLDCDYKRISTPSDPCSLGPVTSAYGMPVNDCALIRDQQG